MKARRMKVTQGSSINFENRLYIHFDLLQLNQTWPFLLRARRLHTRPCPKRPWVATHVYWLPSLYAMEIRPSTVSLRAWAPVRFVIGVWSVWQERVLTSSSRWVLPFNGECRALAIMTLDACTQYSAKAGCSPIPQPRQYVIYTGIGDIKCSAGKTASLYASEPEVHCPRLEVYVVAVSCARAADRPAARHPWQEGRREVRWLWIGCENNRGLW